MATINKEIHVEETYTELLAKINKSVYAKFPLIEVTVSNKDVCSCEAHTFYEQEKAENECLGCGKQIYKTKADVMSININSINTIEE